MVDRDVLLVEDNEEDEILTLRAFKKNNFKNRIQVARDGVEALEYLFANLDRLPAVILLDLKLPRVDGHEVLKRIRADARTSKVPVVVLTSSNEEVDLQQVYEHGANSYIRKPVDFNAFVEAVRQLGIYWLVVNEPPSS